MVRAAILTDGPTPGEAATIAAHFAYLEGLAERGVLILAGGTQTTGAETFGITIFNTATDDEARAIMAADPAVTGGVMHAELFPYRVALIREQTL